MNREFYTYTEFPEIYKKCYWGHCSREDGPGQSVVDARNAFIRRHRIKGWYSLSTAKYRKKDWVYDHQEFYEDNLGRIIHIYSQDLVCGVDPTFERIAPMYWPSPSYFTAMKTMETRRSTTRLMKTIYNRFLEEISDLIQAFVGQSKKRKRSYVLIPIKIHDVGK